MFRTALPEEVLSYRNSPRPLPSKKKKTHLDPKALHPLERLAKLTRTRSLSAPLIAPHARVATRSTLIIVELCVSGRRSAAKRLTHFSQRKLGELQAANRVRLGSVRSFALSLSLSLSLSTL